MKILIVDDEQLARERLKDLISESDGSHSIREAGNGLIALDVVEEWNPDLVLLDIRMPVMDGMEAAYHMANRVPQPAVVFTTAYQDHAIEAFETNAADYLLKPIHRERLQQSIEKARVLNRARITLLRDNDPGVQARTHLSTSNLGKIELIPVAEICFLKAEQKYVMVGWRGRETLIDDSLKSLEAEFSDRFLRIHRNALIALAFVEAFTRDRDGKYRVRLRGVKEELAVSRRHLRDVRRVMKNPGSRPA